MKKMTMKKLLALGCAFVLACSMLGCSGKTEEPAAPEESADAPADTNADSETPSSEGSKDSYSIAIVKQMDHASLDEIANAVAARLDAIASEKGITISHEIYSGQGDQTTLKQIGDQLITDKVDAIIPIATLAAQVMVSCAKDTNTPVVFAAISDPAEAGLVDIDYVTGTSDALNTSFILDMMFAQNPDIEKVGLLYSQSEANSTTPIAEAKAYLEAKNISYSEQPAATSDEVIACASALIAEGVDAIFTPTDNVIMASELAIYEDLAKAGIPHYTGADSFVRNGAFTTCGVNYTDLGTQTADLAFDAIVNGMTDMDDFYLTEGGIIIEMGEVVEVITTED